MYIILGATGHIGSTVAKRLLKQGEEVTIITRDEGKSDEWKQKGAKVAVVDVRDVEALRQVFRTGKRLFLLNPPALPSTDTVMEEQENLSSIIAALDGSGIEKIVAESTYGAQAGDNIGDLGVLYAMEQQLAKTGIPAIILRGAYYMSNWDAYLQTARDEGKIYTLYPADFRLAMVDPVDIGEIAAGFLTEPVEKTGLYHVEGPTHYSSNEVAKAFSEALGKDVQTEEIEPEAWIPFLTKAGFSQKAAESMAAMTDLTLHTQYDAGNSPIRGKTSIREYVRKLV